MRVQSPLAVCLAVIGPLGSICTWTASSTMIHWATPLCWTSTATVLRWLTLPVWWHLWIPTVVTTACPGALLRRSPQPPLHHLHPHPHPAAWGDGGEGGCRLRHPPCRHPRPRRRRAAAEEQCWLTQPQNCGRTTRNGTRLAPSACPARTSPAPSLTWRLSCTPACPPHRHTVSRGQPRTLLLQPARQSYPPASSSSWTVTATYSGCGKWAELLRHWQECGGLFGPDHLGCQISRKSLTSGESIWDQENWD